MTQKSEKTVSGRITTHQSVCNLYNRNAYQNIRGLPLAVKYKVPQSPQVCNIRIALKTTKQNHLLFRDLFKIRILLGWRQNTYFLKFFFTIIS